MESELFYFSSWSEMFTLYMPLLLLSRNFTFSNKVIYSAQLNEIVILDV